MKDFQTVRKFKASVADVFAAWTMPEKVALWWNPFHGGVSIVHELNAAQGGNAHITVPQPAGAKPLEFYLSYHVYRIPHAIEFTVRDDPQHKESPLMKVFFDEKDGKTVMTFLSPNIPIDAYLDATRGWNEFFDKLQKVVEQQ